MFTVAYRILGGAADAEDAVQDTWLKWSAADRGRRRSGGGIGVGRADGLLETLSPRERAVFVLKEAFALSYAEIAAATTSPTPTSSPTSPAARCTRSCDAR